MNMKTPNILLIVSDQERQRDWLPAGLDLPARQRLLDEGLEFTNYYTHTSPRLPHREQHYSPDNTCFNMSLRKTQQVLKTRTFQPPPQLLGHMLRNVGYKTGYKGKWHLQNQRYPEMESTALVIGKKRLSMVFTRNRNRVRRTHY